MRPNDETIYNGAEVENEENPQVENENQKKAPWAKIGLGAATGILMGAGAIFATKAMAADGDESQVADNGGNATHVGEAGGAEQLHVATVTPGQSFSQAFAEARAEVGPGGVFHWNGGIYNTYTEEEWNAMSDDQKQDFAESVRPEYNVSQVNTSNISEDHPRVHVVATPEPEPEADPTVNVNIDEVHIHYHEGASGDDEVHVVGYVDSEVDIIDDDVVVVDHYTVDGHKAAVVDFIDEDKHDIAIVDLNDNQEIDDGEAMDLHTGDLLDSDLNPMTVAMDDVNIDVAPDPSFDA